METFLGSTSRITMCLPDSEPWARRRDAFALLLLLAWTLCSHLVHNYEALNHPSNTTTMKLTEINSIVSGPALKISPLEQPRNLQTHESLTAVSWPPYEPPAQEPSEDSLQGQLVLQTFSGPQTADHGSLSISVTFEDQDDTLDMLNDMLELTELSAFERFQVIYCFLWFLQTCDLLLSTMALRKDRCIMGWLLLLLISGQHYQSSLAHTNGDNISVHDPSWIASHQQPDMSPMHNVLDPTQLHQGYVAGLSALDMAESHLPQTSTAQEIADHGLSLFYAWLAHECSSMISGTLPSWTKSKWYYSEEVADEMSALHDYVGLLAEADIDSGSIAHVTAAFDLGASDPEAVLAGLEDWRSFLDVETGLGAHLLELPIAWGECTEAALEHLLRLQFPSVASVNVSCASLWSSSSACFASPTVELIINAVRRFLTEQGQENSSAPPTLILQVVCLVGLRRA